MPLAPAAHQDEVRYGSDSQGCGEPPVAEAKRPDQPGGGDDGDGREHEQPLRGRPEQTQLPETPRLAEALGE